MPDDEKPDPFDRVDRWLWHARFARTRSLAQKLVRDGAVRLNGTRVEQPANRVRPGDVLTLVLAQGVRVVRIAAIGARRGPAAEARGLYADQDRSVPCPGRCDDA
ncbi:MAG: RNA-binding S4 domain-containing protein [Pseudomonadota bacterium]